MKQKNSRKHAGLLWITMGLLLIAAALFLATYNLYDGLRAEHAAGQAADKLDAYLLSEAAPEVSTDLAGERTTMPDYVLCPHMEMPTLTINGTDFIGVLRIPALALELPIISEWNDSHLKTAPCRYSGSAYLHNLIICGHNYTSHFGNLKNLREGDLATFTDMDGNVFTYRMVERETLPPTSVDAMESGDWDLTLFTCTMGGQSRVTIRFELEEN